MTPPNPEQRRAAALIMAIASGDRRALSDLIQMFGRRLTLLAARYLGNDGDAEEVAQDVFVRVWRSAERYDPSVAKVSTWLYRIAVNQCVDRHRKRALLRFVGLDDRAMDLPDPQPSAADRLDGGTRLAAVRAALDRLPQRQRMALLLSVVAEMTTGEIAEVLRTTPGAVEQVLVRARRSLRDVVDRDEDAKL